jgi:threonylcarbamoyladenosine tRNA methylthiotransferase MtaB
MKTFHVHTLGCKVNHYESEQIAAVLRSLGLVETDPSHADLRVVNTCSVTTEAAAKSRQASRRMVRLPVLGQESGVTVVTHDCPEEPAPSPAAPSPSTTGLGPPRHPRVIVTGCWATSDRDAAASLPGVDAILTHHGDVAAELRRLLLLWRGEEERGGRRDDPDRGEGVESGDNSRPQRRERHAPADSPIEPIGPLAERPPEQNGDDGWIEQVGLPAPADTTGSKAGPAEKVKLQIYALSVDPKPEIPPRPENFLVGAGTTRLPLLGDRQTGRQRAFLKVQDGCDAHCTYCIIPRLRRTVWSKPVADAVEEARRLVAAGHVEIVLTGVFLSAYGHATALRRRRPEDGSPQQPLAELVDALCIRVPGLRRLRLSSLEPGDLTDHLVAVFRSHAVVVPHFHLPLQSGSDLVLRRMNRQYTRDDYLRMLDRVTAAFDRPALTTDVIVGFPGETDAEFERTAEVVDHARFVHVHAFPFSARPGTAAARWTARFVPGKVANQRLAVLSERAEAHSLAFRQQFVGDVVKVLVERNERPGDAHRHGRSERYFDVHFEAPAARPGDFARVRVDRVTPGRTCGTLLSIGRVGGAA